MDRLLLPAIHLNLQRVKLQLYSSLPGLKAENGGLCDSTIVLDLYLLFNLSCCHLRFRRNVYDFWLLCTFSIEKIFFIKKEFSAKAVVRPDANKNVVFAFGGKASSPKGKGFRIFIFFKYTFCFMLTLSKRQLLENSSLSKQFCFSVRHPKMQIPLT